MAADAPAPNPKLSSSEDPEGCLDLEVDLEVGFSNKYRGSQWVKG